MICAYFTLTTVVIDILLLSPFSWASVYSSTWKHGMPKSVYIYTNIYTYTYTRTDIQFFNCFLRPVQTSQAHNTLFQRFLKLIVKINHGWSIHLYSHAAFLRTGMPVEGEYKVLKICAWLISLFFHFDATFYIKPIVTCLVLKYFFFCFQDTIRTDCSALILHLSWTEQPSTRRKI